MPKLMNNDNLYDFIKTKKNTNVHRSISSSRNSSRKNVRPPWNPWQNYNYEPKKLNLRRNMMKSTMSARSSKSIRSNKKSREQVKGYAAGLM